jgi:hypothetical protein
MSVEWQASIASEHLVRDAIDGLVDRKHPGGLAVFLFVGSVSRDPLCDELFLLRVKCELCGTVSTIPLVAFPEVSAESAMRLDRHFLRHPVIGFNSKLKSAALCKDVAMLRRWRRMRDGALTFVCHEGLGNAFTKLSFGVSSLRALGTAL